MKNSKKDMIFTDFLSFFVFLTFFLSIFAIFPQKVYAKHEKIYKNASEEISEKSLCEKMSFWKKTKKYKQKHKIETPVETREKWLIEAESVPLELRDNPKESGKINEKLRPFILPDAYIVKYNDPPGSNETDLSELLKSKLVRSDGVISEDFKKMAYTEYYYYPNTNQIVSQLFALNLDLSKPRIERIKNANILNSKKQGALKSSIAKYKTDMASYFTIVDWSKNNDLILVKEKIGSLVEGVYKTNIYLVQVDETGKTLAYRDFQNLEDIILKHYNDLFETRMNFYRWNIKPLGWNKENENEIIAIAYAYKKQGSEAFLGLWAINYQTNEVRLISQTNPVQPISIYGYKLKYTMK